jgi:hypothetical protein
MISSNFYIAKGQIQENKRKNEISLENVRKTAVLLKLLFLIGQERSNQYLRF